MAAAAAAAEAPGSWRAAAPRKRRRSAARRPRGREAAALGRETQTEADRAVVLRRLQEAAEDLLLSDFWSLALETINSCLTKHLEQLKAPDGTLLEALGNLHLNSSPDESAVTPGAIPGETLVPGTCRWKCIPRRHCWVYDPLFSQLEIGVLNSLGLTVLSENEEGKRSVDGEPTIFYMPHCGTALYNNLLWSNWSLDALSQMLLIGNSFQGLEERLLGRILQKNYTYIAKILKGLEELELPETSQYTDVFNDTSIHWFPVQKLQQLPTDTWAFQEEPDYQDCEDLEIIRNKTRDH
ncbi:SRR1-like protein isoform 2-T2 [Lycaon pictus]